MSAGLHPAPRVGGTARERPPIVQPRAERADWGWVLQALTGAAVLVLVGIHMVAQHFVVPDGLRGYAAVVAWLASPVVVVLEVAFLGSVTWHALLGVRAMLLDLGPSARAERWITRILVLIGAATVLYGLWLTGVVIGAW